MRQINALGPPAPALFHLLFTITKPMRILYIYKHILYWIPILGKLLSELQALSAFNPGNPHKYKGRLFVKSQHPGLNVTPLKTCYSMIYDTVCAREKKPALTL